MITNPTTLHRFYHPDNGIRLGVRIEDTVYDVTEQYPSFHTWLLSSSGRVQSAIDELIDNARTASVTYPASNFNNLPSADTPHWLPPIDHQAVWAAGVTYEQSRSARQEEAEDGGDIYARVYNAPRPELFFKANAHDVVGTHGNVGIRSDATWSVPEPELTLVMNPALEVIGFTAGNDMSSRDIEGANPLYLPQAKMYTASCALGDGILLHPSTDWIETEIHLTIRRQDEIVVEDRVHTDRIKRTIPELIGYLGRSLNFPNGVCLMTGTGIVPPLEFTLHEGDEVTIQIDGVATLTNTVITV